MPTEYIGGIALIGDPGSGKSSIGEELRYALNWESRSFATCIKSDVAKMLAGSYVWDWSPILEEMARAISKDKYRPLLQAYGSLKRLDNPDYWVDRTLQRISPDEKYVIDDCRYFNEYEALRARGFKFIYLQRGPTTRALPAEQAAHESEQDWHRFKTDIVLTYEPGPKHQAERIIRMLKLNGDIDTLERMGNPSTFLTDAYELDAATKGLAGVVAGPDDTMDGSLFIPLSTPAVVAGSITVTFEEGLTMRSGQTLHIPHPYIEEAAVAWPI